MSLSTGYVRTHIYIENMRTKKALSAWIPLVSVFCSSGAVSGWHSGQANDACIGMKVSNYIIFIAIIIYIIIGSPN